MDRERDNFLRRRRCRELRWEALLAYTTPEARANDTPQCIRCGYSRNSIPLSIHHSDRTGAKHRRQIGRSSTALYRWLKKKNYPPHFETLCMNCQRIDEFACSREALAKSKRRD